ncbi:Ig-like domain-containing protein [Hymenobacter metallilatus]|nr:T9SS type A sorting domain-containing protein [Hymenobacter metallilatus]
MAIPVARTETSQIMLNSFGRTALSRTLSATDPDNNPIASYIINTLPPTASGVLELSGTAVTAGQVIPAANIGNLTFDPAAGYFGLANFTYSARDNANETSTTVTYAIPVSNQSCAQNSGLDFFNRTLGEDWAAGRSVTVQGTTITAGSYTAPASTTTFNIADQGADRGIGLTWTADYTATNAATSSVTFTFDRAVSGFSFVVNDIDRQATGAANTTWTDELTVAGIRPNGTTITLGNGDVIVGSNNTNTYNGNNIITGTASNTGAAGNVLITFPEAINRLVLTYKNTQTTYTNPGGQFVTFTSFSWCSRSDVGTAIAGPASAPAGSTVSYTVTTTNNGPDVPATITPTVQLPTGLSGVTGGTYNSATGLLTLAPVNDLASGNSTASIISFVLPAAGATSTSGFTTSIEDVVTVNNTASISTTVRATGASGTAGPCATAGRDGSATISTNPVTYYPTTNQTVSVNGTSIVVGAATGAATNIAAGDLLLVVQMQGADITSSNSSAYGDGVAGIPANGNTATNFTAGQYEYVVANNAITATAGGTLTLTTGLKNAYQTAAATGTQGRRVFQVVRIPQYLNLTLGANITPKVWDGTTGGIIALDVAGQLNLAGFTIDASGSGFRGGAGRQLAGDKTNPTTLTGTDYRSLATLNANGMKGEGTAGTPRYVNNAGTLFDTGVEGYPNGSAGRGAPGTAGGGGTDSNPVNNDENTGGGGGANGGAGGRGGNAWNSNAAVGGEAGGVFTASSSSRVVLGGGGGAGSTNNGTGTPGTGFASSGATGGGIVLLRTGTVAGSGTILADGASANNSVANDGSGGGGAGGSIVLTANVTSGLSGLTLSAKGGNGGTNTGGGAPHGTGGGGGGGVILTNGAPAAATITAGANGTTPGGGAFGAEPGNAGFSNAAISNSIANSTAGINCIADVATTITGPASANAGSTVSLNVTFANNGGQPAAGATRTVTLPAGVSNVVASGGTVSGTVATGYTITYSGTPLAAVSSNSFTITYTAPGTGPVVAQSNTSTTTSEGANPGLTGNNSASVSTAISTVADVATTLTTSQTNVAPGATITYTAQVTNNGPSPALSVVPTVQLPAGLNLTTTNLPDGGTYNNDTGLVTFPTTSSLASGASTPYRIIFPAPNYNTTITGKAASTSTTTDPTATNNDGSQANANVTTVVTLPTNGCAGAQYGPTRSSGLYGEYFSGYFADDLTFFNGKTAGLARYDATLNFASSASWGNLTPTAAGTASNPDTYTARYRGSINIATAGSYTFYLNSDDAAYLWLDGAALAPTIANAAINNGGLHSAQERTVTLTLSAGVHNLLVVYGENGGINVLTLEYASAGANVARQIIPNSVLCASASQPPVANNVTNTPAIPDNNGPTAIAALSATDPDGQIDSYTIVTLPPAAAGVLYLVSGSTLTAVTAGQVIPAASAGNLRFDPVSGYGTNGGANASFTYSATDNSGTVSNTATYTLTVGVAPVAVNDQNFTAPNTAVSFNVATNDTGPKDAATVDLDPNTAGIQTTKTVAGQGTFTVDNAGLVTFTPVNGFTGTAVIPYTINGTSGAVSNQASIAVTVRSLADVATTVSSSASTVTAGQSVTFTVTTTNVNTAGNTPATGVTQTLQLPAGLGTVTFSNGGSYNNTTGLVTLLSNGTLALGASNTYGVTFTAPASGPVVGTAQVTTTSNETVLSNNLNSVSVAVTPTYDLTTRISGPASVVAGQPVTFSVSSLNLGSGLASTVAQTVTLPRNLTNVYVSDNGIYDAASGVVTFPTLASLPSGQNVNHVISFVAPGAGTISAVANISGAGNETPTTNNQATASLTVNSAGTTNQANLFSTITSSTAAPAPGEVYTYTVTYGNNGPATGTNTSLRILLAPGLTVTGLPSGYSYNSTTGEITPSAVTATMASGFSSNFTFSVTAPAAGTVLATSAIAGTTIDPVPGNNQTEVSVTVTPRTDLLTTVSGPSTAVANQLVTYNVSASNSGAAAAAAATQVVRIPAYLGTANVTITGGGTYNNTTGEVTFDLGTVNAGTQVQNTISFYMPTETQISVVSSVATGTPETNVANNTASVTTTSQRSSDVQVFLASPASPIVAGTPVVYSVTTANNGEAPAASVTTTVQLPAGLTGVTVSGGGSYDAATGVVTFATRTEVPAGPDGTITNTISFLAPDAKRLTATAVANVSNATNDLNLGNNVVQSSIVVNQPTTSISDLAVAISSDASTYTAGSPITYTVTVTNNGTADATDVRTRIALPGDLTGFSGPAGASYSTGSGVVLITSSTANVSLASGSSLTYSFSVNAPGAGPVVAVASTSSDNTDNVPANNISQNSVNITSLADVQTVLDGVGTAVAGSTVSYTVITRNNGASPASNVQQTVQLPTGLTGVVVSGGGSYDSNSGVVTFPTISSLNSGTAQAVINTISFPFPTASYRLVANVSTTTAEGGVTANNTDPFTTNIANQAPVARNVVNNITAPDATNAAVDQPIAALAATDADGTIRSFTISNLPNTTTQGTLYVNGVAATEGQVVTLADASKLSFKPVNGFVGNAFFNYTALDNNSLVSNNTAVYTIPVASDNNSSYATTPAKGGSNRYQNNDVLAYVVDPNGAVYNGSGVIYDATTGALVSGSVANGLPTSGTNATISAADQNKLSAVGLALNPATGQVYVANRLLLKQGTYSVSITTTDIYGGVTTQTVNIPVGASPLPVTLVSFTATAAGQDAKLAWTTAQEVNNAYFLVERSFDGHSFEVLKQVQGQGTTATATPYALLDAQVAAKAQGRLAYYRLRQVDTDGTEALSSVQTVRFAAALLAGEAQLYPNPASSATDARLDLSALPAGTYQVTITDLAGRRVRSFQQAGGSSEALHVTELPSGSYLVQVQGNGQSVVKRLTKE